MICTNDPSVFHTDLLIRNSESGEMYFAREVWPEARIPMVPVDGHRHKHLSKKQVKFFLNYCLCLNETGPPFQPLNISWPQLFQTNYFLFLKKKTLVYIDMSLHILPHLPISTVPAQLHWLWCEGRHLFLSMRHFQNHLENQDSLTSN